MRLVLGFLLAFPFAALAQDLPAPLTDTVSDYADILPADAEAALTDTLIAARKETGVQIVVVTMAHTADYGGAGQSIESYAKNLFNAWGVGDKDRDDGIMVLVARDDGAMRIALGDGFGPVFDGAAQRVIDSVMLPEFRQGKFKEGIVAGADGVIDRLARPYASNNPPPPEAFDWKALGDLGMFGVILMGVGLFVARRLIGDQIARFRTCPQCGGRGLHRARSVTETATQALSGLGLQITRCDHCSYETRTTYTIPRLKSGSGSSGGGFGGGSSSGGGASGRW